MKIVLFDIDETLLSCPPKTNPTASREMFNKVFNIDTDEEVIDHQGKTEKRIILEVLDKFGIKLKEFEDIPNQAYLVWATAVKEILEKTPPKILPGIHNLLEELSKDKDIILTLLTGNSRIRAEVKMNATNISHYFKENGILRGIFGDISTQRSDLIPEAKKKWGKGTYIIIDDSLVAAEMIKGTNTPGILVGTGGYDLNKLKQYSPFVFPDFGEDRWKEVVKIIREIPDSSLPA